MRIGVLGAGQLGRMLALAGYPLGLEFVFYDNNPEACASHLGTYIQGEFTDFERLSEFASQVDIATLEWENVPVAALQHVAQTVPVYPSPRAVAAAQDRLEEKRLFTELGIPTPAFYTADNAGELASSLSRHGGALIAKSRRFGYDGKGQLPLSGADNPEEAWKALGGVPLIAEERMNFSREVSMIAARGRSGELRFYPLAENVHGRGILLRSRASVDDPMQSKAEDYIQRVMQALDYVGVLAFEFFQCNGELVANEIAPRVHNSGHWTIEGAITSQFENHLRAILGWPLGETAARNNCVMYNLIGEFPDMSKLLAVPGAHVHCYGKAPRPGRKIGHVTLCNPSPEAIRLVEVLLPTIKS